MLYTKCIKARKGRTDGLRISVMSRHALSDGVTPEPEITQDMYHEWWPVLGPSPELIGAYLRGRITWEIFAAKYCLELRKKTDDLNKLVRLALDTNVTLLCIEPTPLHCHRRLLAEACQKLNTRLRIVIM